jgi:uncharacterized paraquat-inducible protein A
MEEKKMTKTCNNCKTKNDTVIENQNVSVPYVVHEATVARQERQIKRMWIALIVAIALMFFTNMMWVGVFSSYDYSSEEIIVDAEDNGNANYIGQDGNIYNGEDNSAETQED